MNSQNTPQDQEKPVLTFVVPAYNERPNLRPMVDRIRNTCSAANISDFEVIFIENGSYDGSADVIRELHQSDRRIKMIRFSRNFGYQVAISAGLHFSRGEWVAVIDGDQQDPPELITEMLRRARDEGYDVVYGVRMRRREGLFKRSCYAAFYRIWRMTANIDIPIGASEFALYHRSIVEVLNAFTERMRFVRGLRAWVGFRQLAFPYDRDARGAGESKFNLRSSILLAMDGLFAYSMVPIRLTIFAGFCVTLLSLLIALLDVALWVVKVVNPNFDFIGMPKGLTQINLVFTLLFGTVLLCLGVIGEYIGRIFEEVKQRPLFLVRERLL